MTGFLEGVSNFFARHRAHCLVHEVYQSDCAACVTANQGSYIDPGTVVVLDGDGDSFLSPDSSSADSSSADSSSSDTADFGGFDGGDSGGGGSSGDF